MTFTLRFFKYLRIHAFRIRALFLHSALLLPCLLAGCSGKGVKGQGGPGGGPTGAAKRAVLVTAAPVVQRAVPLSITSLIGTVEPVATVTITARVGGQLDKVYFKEGDEVKEGDLLFTIDRRPLEAELRQAEASLARDQAQALNARNDAKRYQDLSKRGAVAASENEKIQATFEALEATIRADRAAIENARLQIGYTEIRAPISGRTGRLQIDRGNLIKANDTDLVTINQLTPIYVTFPVDQGRLPEIKRYLAQHPIEVRAFIDGDNGPPEDGALTFIDNTVNSSLQIQLRGTFPNKDHRLWPGQYVQVELQLATQPQAILAPATAIQNGQEGTYVFTIKPDLTVEMRPVTIDRQLGEETVIAAGLKPNERVVTDGQLQLVPGSKVEIRGEGPRGPAARPGKQDGKPS